MSYNYVVTAHKATVVSSSVTGNFTGPDDLNLIQVKGSDLAISLVTAEGLKPVLDVDVFGRVSCVQLFRPKTEKKDLLFILTARYHVAIVSYDHLLNDVVTRAYGDIKDRVGKPTSGKMTALVDPTSSLIVLHMYSGLLKVVPLHLDSGQPLQAFNIRLEDLYIIDIQFIHGAKDPTIAYLAEDPSVPSGRALKSFVVSVRDKELSPGPWTPIVTETHACILWPVPSPYNGMLVIGMESIAYYSEGFSHSVDPVVIKESLISCVESVDHSRYLLGDFYGRLLMLFLDFKENMETGLTVLSSMKIEVLGEISNPHTLSYLDNGVIFVGSSKGDSQLIKLSSTPVEGEEGSSNNSYIEVLESMANIGPILDMSVVDLDRQGRDVLVCCSGVGKDGSLRIVKSGIGINEAASIDLAGIKGIWSLRCRPEDPSSVYHNTVIISFVGQTMALSLAGEEVEETDLPGLVSDQQTFYCGNVSSGTIVQITMKSVRLLDENTMNLICEWSPPDGRGISTATCNSSQIVVAVGCDLYYLEVKPGTPGELLLISHTVMSHEVACVDITTPTSISPSSSSSPFSLCAVGLWTDISVQIMTLPAFEHLFTQPLGGDIIPRSILMAELGGVCYLLCALGDGYLHYYVMDTSTGHLNHGKKVLLGTKPIVLRLFESQGSMSVFACSDHPTIIHSSNQKLLFSNVNVKEVNYICSLNSEAFQNSLALVDSNTLIFGSVDQIQMLHIESIPLGESPRCIAYQESSGTFLIGSYRIDKYGENGTTPTRQSASTRCSNMTVCPVPPKMIIENMKCLEIEIHSLILLDQNTFEVNHTYQLCPQENILSVTSCNLTFEDEERSVYIVGTALVRPDEKEASLGRVLVFQVNNGKLELLYEKMEEGAVYQVHGFNGKILNTVNSAIYLNVVTAEGEIKEECSYKNNILALYLKTKGDFILVGDILRSLKLLVYKGEQGGLEEIGVDHHISPCFCTAIEMIDDENYLASDGRHIFICQKNTEATVESELMYMLQPSRMYLGDNINVFNRGSFVINHPGGNASLLQGKPILFGTVHGAIGLIGTLRVDTYTLLSKLQQKMASCIKSIGHIEHDIYRSFSNEHRSKPFAGLIDGDLVEKFLELPRPQMNEIVQDIKGIDTMGVEIDVSVDDMLKLIEDLSRLH